MAYRGTPPTPKECPLSVFRPSTNTDLFVTYIAKPNEAPRGGCCGGCCGGCYTTTGAGLLLRGCCCYGGGMEWNGAGGGCSP